MICKNAMVYLSNGVVSVGIAKYIIFSGISTRGLF